MSAARLLLAAALAAFLFLQADVARADPSPDVIIYEAYAFRSIVDENDSGTPEDEGDLLILIRYELPVSSGTTTAGFWCDELENQSGCDDDPPDPDEPSSLPRGAATLRFYTEATNYLDNDPTGAVLETSVQIPRIGHGIGGIYFSSGHGHTFDPSPNDSLACVESSGTLFDAAEVSCTRITWFNGANTSLAQRDGFGSRIRQLVLNLESEAGLALNTLVRNARITQAGQVYTDEAFAQSARVSPEYFQTGGRVIFTTPYVTPNATQAALQHAIQATATATTVYANVLVASREFTGLQGQTFGAIAAVVAGFVFAGVGYGATKKPAVAGMGFFIPLYIGAWIAMPQITMIATVVFVLIILTGLWIVRRMPN